MIRKLILYIQNPLYLSIGFVFATMSILLSFWVTRLSFIKDKFEMTDGDLGLALFFIPAGAVITMLITSRLINYLGEGKTAFYSVFLLAICSVLPFIARDTYELWISLVFLGASMGLVDVSINAATGHVESQHKTSIMSTSHGFFSLGGIIGAALASFFIGLAIDPLIQMITTSTLI